MGLGDFTLIEGHYVNFREWVAIVAKGRSTLFINNHADYSLKIPFEKVLKIFLENSTLISLRDQALICPFSLSVIEPTPTGSRLIFEKTQITSPCTVTEVKLLIDNFWSKI